MMRVGEGVLVGEDDRSPTADSALVQIPKPLHRSLA